MEKGSLLIVDDDQELLAVLARRLAGRGFEVDTASSLGDGRARVDARAFDAALLDLNLASESGLDLLAELARATPTTGIVLMSGDASVPSVVEAMRRGALDFLEKPLDLARVEVALDKAVDRARLLRENESLREHLKAASGPGPAIPASSLGPAMRQLHEDVTRLAATNMPVLILGESGTGKEFIARALHDLSPRAPGPWLPINCGAFQRDLIESELFGHEKGAFTGAHDRKLGLAEVARSGTLFLDEVADMSLEVQVKLLRFIETGELRRVGGTEARRVDVRIVAATNRDLAGAIRVGRFREDLYFRLSAATLRLPPLRERREEVPIFARHFLALRGEKESFPAPVLAALAARDWPGNLRQLRNAVDKLLVLRGSASLVRLEDLRAIEEVAISRPAPVETSSPEEEDLSLATMERRQIVRALERFDGNQTRAAEALGVSVRTLYRRVRELGLKP
jgi:DNA-binding NtrC family response regulator